MLFTLVSFSPSRWKTSEYFLHICIMEACSSILRFVGRSDSIVSINFLDLFSSWSISFVIMFSILCRWKFEIGSLFTSTFYIDTL